MKNFTLTAIILIFAFISNLFANEVNIFSARHYDSDIQLYEKFTAKTGIKVNVVSGKSGALEKRIIEEGADSMSESELRSSIASNLSSFLQRDQGFETVPTEKDFVQLEQRKHHTHKQIAMIMNSWF